MEMNSKLNESLFAGWQVAVFRTAFGVEPIVNRAEDGQNLFEQGDLGELVYVVAEGEIDLWRQLAEGGEAHIHTCAAGEYFGELAPLLGFPRSATARARTNCVVHGVTVQEVREKAGAEGVRKAMGTPARA